MVPMEVIHMAVSEWRPEICEDCGDSRDREWRIQLIPKGSAVPPGWRVARRQPASSWKTIERPTRWVSLCLCGAA